MAAIGFDCGGESNERLAQRHNGTGPTLATSIHTLPSTVKMQTALQAYSRLSAPLAIFRCNAAERQREACHGHPGHARARAGCPWHVERGQRHWRSSLHAPSWQQFNSRSTPKEEPTVTRTVIVATPLCPSCATAFRDRTETPLNSVLFLHSARFPGREQN